MKLKTLKDLERKANPDFVYSKELKAEAIKWVKYYNLCDDLPNREDWIEFFNITEEDLSQSDIKQLNEEERANGN